MIRARLLTEGAAQGPVLALDEPLSFWGAFEPRTGVIIDVHHPQRGACVRDTMLLMTETRGSMNLSEKDGGLPPDSVVQDEDEILADCERVIGRYLGVTRRTGRPSTGCRTDPGANDVGHRRGLTR